jgi:putative methyltransferase (TIGR04325 family)
METVRRFRKAKVSFRRTSSTFNNAYDQLDFQKNVFTKTQIFAGDLEKYLSRNLTIAKLAGLAFVSGQGNKSKNIIDLGGGAGIDYFIYRELIGGDKLWTCLETEALCQVLTNSKITEKRLKFSSLSDFLQHSHKRFDFALYSNSALQYIPEPANVLNDLLSLRPTRVAIIRTPFVIGGGEVRTTQKSILDKNGPQVGGSNIVDKEILNTLTIVNIEIIRKLFEQNGYRVICENIQPASFIIKKSIIELKKSRVRTVDFLALRMD